MAIQIGTSARVCLALATLCIVEDWIHRSGPHTRYRVRSAALIISRRPRNSHPSTHPDFHCPYAHSLWDTVQRFLFLSLPRSRYNFVHRLTVQGRTPSTPCPLPRAGCVTHSTQSFVEVRHTSFHHPPLFSQQRFMHLKIIVR